jgi:hypothetical protein
LPEQSDFAASMPVGIDVDEAAAYFGVIESSDTLHSMLAMGQREAILKFFSILSDIVLLPGDFNFEAASERMQCEGGEIYYLVSGHLGLMSMQDPLSRFIGQPDSMGESSAADSSLSADEKEKLSGLADPMRLMKLLAVGYSTGGETELSKYLDLMKTYIDEPSASKTQLLSICDELDAALDIEGHILPLPSLASGSATASTIDTTLKIEATEPVISVPQPQVETPPISVPLPTQETPKSSSTNVPLPSSPRVELPKVEVISAEPQKIESDKQMEKATQDAFAGAFTIGLHEEPTLQENDMDDASEEDLLSTLSEDNDVQEDEVEHVMTFEDPLQSEIQFDVQLTEDQPQQEEEFVSAAERFIAADTDGSGALSIEELAEATGTSLEEATRLHKEADTDGDGTVSLGEFVSSEAGQKAQNLPRPIAPVRKPLGAQQTGQPQQSPPAQPQQQQPQQWQQQPQQQQPQQWHQQPQQWQQQPQQWQQQPQQWQQQPQQWQQPQPTIRSGVFCRGCGIGLDPYWRFCPVCGAPNQ